MSPKPLSKERRKRFSAYQLGVADALADLLKQDLRQDKSH